MKKVFYAFLLMFIIVFIYCFLCQMFYLFDWFGYVLAFVVFGLWLFYLCYFFVSLYSDDK